MLGELSDQRFGHPHVFSRLTCDLHVTAECGGSWRIERAVGLAGQAAEPDQFGLRRADQLRRIWLGGGAFGRFSLELVESCDHETADAVAGHTARKSLEVVETTAVAALGGDCFKAGLLVLAGGFLGGRKLRLLAGFLSFPRLLLGRCFLRRGFRRLAIALGLLSLGLRFGRLPLSLGCLRLLLGLQCLGAALFLFPLLRRRNFGCRSLGLFGGLHFASTALFFLALLLRGEFGLARFLRLLCLFLCSRTGGFGFCLTFLFSRLALGFAGPDALGLLSRLGLLLGRGLLGGGFRRLTLTLGLLGLRLGLRLLCLFLGSRTGSGGFGFSLTLLFSRLALGFAGPGALGLLSRLGLLLGGSLLG